MVDEDRARADARRRAASRSSAAKRAGTTGTHGVVLQLGPVERGELVQLGEVEQARNEVDLLVDHVEAVLQLSRASASSIEPEISRRTGVAEAAAAQLELDRLEQVVRLVRDLEVGVARDPEGRALDDLHPREEPGEEVPDHLLERHEQAARADRQEARQQLRAPSRARSAPRPVSGSRTKRPRLSESPEMYGNGWPGPTASGVSTGKISLLEDVARAPRAPPASRSSISATTMPCAWRGRAAGGASRASPARRRARVVALADLGERLPAACSPSGERTATPGGDLVHQPGDADHEELVQVRGEDRAEVDRSSSGTRVVADELEHPTVEVELRQLAVQEPRLRLGGAHGHGNLSSRTHPGRGVTNSGPGGYAAQPSLASVCLSAETTFAGNGANCSFAPNFWPGPIA